MFSVTGATQGRLITASFGKGPNKAVTLRTAFKSELPVSSFGEVDALLVKNKEKNFVVGYKNSPKPFGVATFEIDLFRKAARVWELPEKSPIASGLVALNVEPGFWILSPQEDMELEKYKSLLEESPWVRIPLENRQKLTIIGEDGKSSIDRSKLGLLDNIIVESMENFIEDGKRVIGTSKYPEEIAHIDNDINRVRLYLQNYRGEGDKFEPFIKSGAFVRVKSKTETVLRPTSQLFRAVILKEIARLESRSKRLYKQNSESKGNLAVSHSNLLKAYLLEHFPNESK